MKCIYATSKTEARESYWDLGKFGGWGTHRVTLVLETSDIKQIIHFNMYARKGN